MHLKSVIRKLALPLIPVALLSGCTDAFRRFKVAWMDEEREWKEVYRER
jgi:hypothetical protein